MKQLKKPWAAALLNFILPGVGYVYAGKRVGFGVGIFLTSILRGFFMLAAIHEAPSLTIFMWVDGFVISILFAYDGYGTAKEVNKARK